MKEDSTNASRMNLRELAQPALSSLTFTSAEERLFKGVEQGDRIVFTSGDSDKDNPGNAGSWGEDRTIRAKCIEWLCYDKQVQDRIHPRGIQVEGAKISKPLNLSFARVPFPLALAECAFTDTMLLQHARIRALNLQGSHVESILADGLNVDSDFFLRNGFKAEGEVRLHGATVGGDLDCSGGQFINKEGKALNAGRAQITGSVFLSDGFKAEGEVRLLGATIGGRLNCSGGQFINKEGNALIADGAQITGTVFLSDSFRAEGWVSLVSAIVKGWFIWKDVLNPDETMMDLRGAHVGTLWDDPNSWPKSGNLHLHGFCYDEIADDAPVDAKQRMEWLRRQPSGHFYPQPYEHLAEVLCAEGHENAAKNVQIAKNVDRRRGGTMIPIAKPLHWLLGLLTGYGYHTWRPLLVGLLLVGIGWGLFHGGARAGVIMRVERDQFVPVDEAVSLVQPHFHPLLYSFDIFLPIINFGHADLWAPNEAIKGPLLISGLFLCCYKWALIVWGWVLTTLFIAGLTGIIRRRV